MLPLLPSPLKPNNLGVHLSFQSASPSSSPGGSKDAREARPTREQKYICTIRAECTVGAASHRKRSGRRHPNQVWKSDCQSLPWKIEQTKKSVIIKPSRHAIKTLWQKAYLSLCRWVWTEQHTVYLSPPPVQVLCWMLTSVLDIWWPCLFLLVKHDSMLGN